MATGPVFLDQAPTTVAHRVQAVQTPSDSPERARWLAELGFLPGEPVQVLRRSLWGGHRLVVRVGTSTFALRRAEAACVQVEAA